MNSQNNRILAHVIGEKLTAEEMAIISGGIACDVCPAGEMQTHIRGTPASSDTCDKSQ